MTKILVNYRREDSAAYAGRLADRLRDHFGAEHVFVDIDTIRPGEDFVDVIDKSVASSDVLVALIGRSWAAATDPAGQRRLDRRDDFVRMEIAKALERRIRVIPVLVGDAVMPEAKDVPEELAPLTRRQAIEISDTRFHQDVDRLIEAIGGSPSASTPAAGRAKRGATDQVRARRSLPWLLGAIGIVLVAVIAYPRWRSGDAASDTGAASRSGQDGATGTVAANTADAVPTGSTGSSAGAGSEMPAPKLPGDADGKTGIQIVWRGEYAVPCYLYDATGEKLLSPAGEVSAWKCGPETGLWDAAPGTYSVKIAGVADTIAPIPVTVTAGKVVRVEPRLGKLRIRWGGSNRVFWYLLDRDGEKTLSPRGVIWAWSLQPGQTSVADVGPGDYMVRVDAPGYQPVKVHIGLFQVTNLRMP